MEVPGKYNSPTQFTPPFGNAMRFCRRVIAAVSLPQGIMPYGQRAGFISETTGFFLLGLVLGALATVLIILYRRGRTERFSIDMEDRFKDVREVADEIITSVHRESLRTMEGAQKQALEMLRTTALYRSEAEKKMERVLEEHSQRESERLSRASEEFLRSYHLSLEDAKKIYLASVKKMNDLMAEETRRGLSEFREELKKEIERYGLETEEEIKKVRGDAFRKIEEYTREKLKKVDESIYQVLALVSKEVLGKSLSMEEHEEVVLRALEEAKREGFFKF